MSSIYSSTPVNIEAASSSNGDEVFLHPRDKALEPPQIESEEAKYDKFVWITPRLKDPFNYNSLKDRAWCYQEVTLSGRALIFGNSQVAFCCRNLIL